MDEWGEKNENEQIKMKRENRESVEQPIVDLDKLSHSQYNWITR